MSELIRVHSADSHLMEPEDLWRQALPKAMADRAPRFQRDDRYETIHLDGEQKFRMLNAFSDAARPPGAYDLDLRLADLDREGVWGQLAFPSRALWLCEASCSPSNRHRRFPDRLPWPRRRDRQLLGDLRARTACRCSVGRLRRARSPPSPRPLATAVN